MVPAAEPQRGGRQEERSHAGWHSGSPPPHPLPAFIAHHLAPSAISCDLSMQFLLMRHLVNVFFLLKALCLDRLS